MAKELTTKLDSLFTGWDGKGGAMSASPLSEKHFLTVDFMDITVKDG